MRTGYQCLHYPRFDIFTRKRFRCPTCEALVRCAQGETRSYYGVELHYYYSRPCYPPYKTWAALCSPDKRSFQTKAHKPQPGGSHSRSWISNHPIYTCCAWCYWPHIDQAPLIAEIKCILATAEKLAVRRTWAVILSNDLPI